MVTHQKLILWISIQRNASEIFKFSGSRGDEAAI